MRIYLAGYSSIDVSKSGITAEEIGCGCCGGTTNLSIKDVQELAQELREKANELDVVVALAKELENANR